MKTIYTDILHNNANQRFHEAQQELQKGQSRDSHGTCMNCKIAMRQYLSAYLIDHGIEPGKFQTIHLLLEKCKQVDIDFEQLDLAAINCRFEQLNDDHCTDEKNLSACVETVRSIKNKAGGD